MNSDIRQRVYCPPMVQPHQLPSSKISDVTDDKQLMDVVGECYEAAADPSRWSEALRRVGTFLRCPCVRILISRHLETSVALAQSYGCPERGLNDARDLHGWLFDSCLSNAQSEDPSAFRHVFATMLWSTEDSTAFVKLARPMTDGPFTESDRERFDGLAPHLGRAMQISQRISESERGRRAALQALERSPYGLVLLNSQTQALHMNARASKILGARDGLSIAEGRLRAAREKEHAALEALIEKANETPLGEVEKAGEVIAVSRPSGKTSFALLVAPVAATQRLLWGRESAVAVFVSDPADETELPTGMLRRVYGLTGAEAALAARLAAGKSLDEAAHGLSIAKTTARTHLRRVLQKTNTRRQADLVRVLMTLPASLP